MIKSNVFQESSERSQEQPEEVPGAGMEAGAEGGSHVSEPPESDSRPEGHRGGPGGEARGDSSVTVANTFNRH